MWFQSLFCLLVTLALLGVAAWMFRKLAPAQSGFAIWQAEWPWFAKGFVAPTLVWMFFNVGFSFDFHALMPSIQNAQNSGGNWIPEFARVVTGGWVIAASAWVAITVVERLWLAYHKMEAEARQEFRTVAFSSVGVLFLPAFALFWWTGWLSIGFVILMLTLPMVGYGAWVFDRPKVKPMYSRAIARIKRGNYSDAEQEILSQLEKAENDFDGWMMLAELHATRFNEIAEAEKVIIDLCLQNDVTPSQISVALHKLADWQINLASDPEAAKRTLKLISDRLPGTHLARMAELRRSRLPSNEEFKQQRETRPIPLPVMPSVIPDPGAPTPTTAPPPVDIAPAPNSPSLTTDPKEKVKQLTEALTREPNNISDRERLARLLAEPLGDVAAAVEQIEVLLNVTSQPDVKRVEWLTLIAGWQLQLQHDEAAGRKTLERIVTEFPGTPQAFSAQRRLNLMKAWSSQSPSV